MKQLGEISAVCAEIVLKCLYLARTGRPDLLWSVNTLARTVTKWNKECDKRLLKLINYINQTESYRQFCHVGMKLKIATLVCSKMLHLNVICGIYNQRQEVFCACWDHTRLFPFHRCARSKPQFLRAVLSLTQVYVWMVHQLFNLGSACWKHCPVNQPRKT